MQIWNIVCEIENLFQIQLIIEIYMKSNSF